MLNPTSSESCLSSLIILDNTLSVLFTFLKRMSNSTFLSKFQILSIKKGNLEEKVLSYWNSKNYKNIIVLNDKDSNLQELILILDILKKNEIDNVSFADDPKI